MPSKCVREDGKEAHTRESDTHAEKIPAKPSADQADCAVETVAVNTCHDRTLEGQLALVLSRALLHTVCRTEMHGIARRAQLQTEH
jgi:hypothetical protein